MQWSNQLSKLWLEAQRTGNHTKLEAYTQRLDAMLMRKPDEGLLFLRGETLRMSASIQQWNAEQIIEDEAPGMISVLSDFLGRRK